MDRKGKALVIFDVNGSEPINTKQYEAILYAKDFILPGSIYEATALVESLPQLKLPSGSTLSKSVMYKGFELWWIHYNDLFYYFGLPFAQYKKLLSHLTQFEFVELHNPPYKPLFVSFLAAHNVVTKVTTVTTSEKVLPFGILIQILITLISIPILIVARPKILVFAGDKFESGKDFDFRMRFVYTELRKRNLHFAEFIRSLSSWKTVVSHALTRMRPVVYSEAVAYISGILGWFTKKDNFQDFETVSDPETRFKLLVGTSYLCSVSTDIWAIKISSLIIKLIGFKVAYFSAALDRNYPAVIGAKLNGVKTVGILHGVASRYYNGYDFLPGFDGVKRLSLDKYGVWSDWWKQYYLKHGAAYTSDQLVVSGPIRPLEKEEGVTELHAIEKTGPIKVLFVSEQLAVPEEVIPYLEKLLQQNNIEILFTFRQFGDGFKNWVEKNRPEILSNPKVKIATSGLVRAIEESEVAVGSHSTAVLEMLLKEKMPLFFNSKKWGDYYSLKEYDRNQTFFAENPDELITKIMAVRTVPKETLLDLQKRYFGNPYQNGSAWLVDELEKGISNS
ncbi:MAG TPA: hypothetical protein VK145_03120 [Candidatus Nanoarchaeia archaeon]|nr:hypothetical protein [Candidatus Nanoarchaeia archaeon]